MTAAPHRRADSTPPEEADAAFEAFALTGGDVGRRPSETIVPEAGSTSRAKDRW